MKTKFHQGGVYTKAPASRQMQYNMEACVGLLLTSWDYPKGDGLKERIDIGFTSFNLFTTLKRTEKSKFYLDNGIVLARKLKKHFTIGQ